MKIIDDPIYLAILIPHTALYSFNELAQDKTIAPYVLLPEQTQEFLINHASTYAGSFTAASTILVLTGGVTHIETTKNKSRFAFGAVATATSLCVYNEYDDIPHNRTQDWDYADLVAIGLGISCFTAVIFNHIRKCKKHERSLSL